MQKFLLIKVESQISIKEILKGILKFQREIKIIIAKKAINIYNKYKSQKYKASLYFDVYRERFTLIDQMIGEGDYFQLRQDLIVILDLGSTQNTAIACEIRDLGVYSEIHPHDITVEELKAFSIVRGIILNGGENRVVAGQEVQV